MILSRNRLFERRAAARSAKSIYIFCEGARREYMYFEYFREMDSRINVEVYKLGTSENNSPSGLLKIAERCIDGTERTDSKYDFQENDEVWIILDVDKDRDDSRGPQISKVVSKCASRKGWNVGQSNPCFEVWLYFHFVSDLPDFENSTTCSTWKSNQHLTIPGGFDSRKHPLLIGDAIKHAKRSFQKAGDCPAVGSTDVYVLGEQIFSILSEKIGNARKPL